MKIDLHNELVDKAKIKKDGVYQFKGYSYAVKNNHFVAYVDRFGYAYMVHGIFHWPIRKCERSDRKKKLLDYINELK